jgi:hypothetical protein
MKTRSNKYWVVRNAVAVEVEYSEVKSLECAYCTKAEAEAAVAVAAERKGRPRIENIFVQEEPIRLIPSRLATAAGNDQEEVDKFLHTC